MMEAHTTDRLLRLTGVEKCYAAPVLSDLHFDLREGEVHALMGANGAGKSTLARIICGVTTPDRGAMTLGDNRYEPRSRRDAQEAGVQLVMQELNLVPTLTVAENLFFADLPSRFGFVSSALLLAKAIEALTTVGLAELDPRTPVSGLGIGQQQLVALAAALAHPCRILVLDEPTASLTEPEIDLLFERLRRLRTAGIAILYISHRFDEIRRISDRITVLRDGRVVGTLAAADASMTDVVRLMVGERAVEALHPGNRSPGDVALRVEGLTRGKRVRNVSFEVRQGEILGLAGLVGSGRTATLRAIFGADRTDAGRVRRGRGEPLTIHGPSDAVKAGIGMIPEDRRAQALLHSQSIRTNMTLAGLTDLARGRCWIDDEREARAADDLRLRLEVRSHSIDQPAGELSGGNQQKVVIARWLLRDCDVLLFDEPTRGIDVAAKIAVYGLLNELADRGKALVIVSSELSELTALCDRIAVLSAGRLVALFKRPDWSEEAILEAAFGDHAQGGGRAPGPGRPC